MSQTPITVTYDIKELFTNFEKKMDAQFERIDTRFERIDAQFEKMENTFNDRFEKLETKIDKIDNKVTNLEIGQAEIKGEIKALDEKVSGIEKRVSNQEFLNRTTVAGLLLIIIGGMEKVIIDWFSNNP